MTKMKNNKITKAIAGLALGAGLLMPNNVSAQDNSDLERLLKHQQKTEQVSDEKETYSLEFNPAWHTDHGEEYFTKTLSTGVESGGNPYVEASMQWPTVMEGCRWNVYARANLGNEIDRSSDTEVTQREKELIGPGTYKERTDTINSVEEKAYSPLEIGLGVDYGFGNNAHAIAKIGATERTTEEYNKGSSTIVYERNNEVIESATISGRETENTAKEIVPVFTLGLQYPLGMQEFGSYAEASLRKIQGEDIKINAGVGYRF